MTSRHTLSTAASALLAAGTLAVGALTAPSAAAASAGSTSSTSASTPSLGTAGTCTPSAWALGYSDALDKQVYDGTEIGGLSDIAWDARSHAYVSTVDNHASDPSRLWFYRNTLDPTIVRDPLVLKQPDGTPYTGVTADNEGLAVDRQGNYIVSSEVEPSIRVFGRDGVQRQQLTVPARFAVAPAGEATNNATLEGLTLSPDKKELVAAMEGTLSGDEPTDGSAADYRRFLVYEQGQGRRSDRATDASWTLTKQVGYKVDDGMRIAEVQEYAPGKLLVLEASWSASAGNEVKLYAVTGLGQAADVSGVANLSTRSDLVMSKTLVADVASCPSMGATALETQANPLMDNFEGMIAQRLHHDLYRVTLVSDDNFSAQQHTRLVDLAVRLP